MVTYVILLHFLYRDNLLDNLRSWFPKYQLILRYVIPWILLLIYGLVFAVLSQNK